jgi:hypothetical protein
VPLRSEVNLAEGKEIYDNGHFMVLFFAFPDSEFRRTQDLYSYERPFAILAICASSKKGTYTMFPVFEGDEVRKITTGHLWWKQVVVSETTQEQRLEDEIVSAVKLADKQKRMVASGEEVVKEATPLIGAIQEVNNMTSKNRNNNLLL